MIGDSVVSIHNGDIINNKKTYKGTPGLWKLLKYTDNPNKDI